MKASKILIAAFCMTLCGAIPRPALAVDIQLVTVTTGLSEPLLLTHAGDGSGRRFVVEHRGRIRIIDGAGAILGTDFLNLGSSGLNRISSVFAGGDERGLLGLAFHPDFASNGYFYVSYTRNSDDASIIARYSVSGGNPNVADTTETVILGPIAQPQTNHNGGMIAFGPDGYLYIAIGDGGGAGDTGTGHTAGIGNSQDTTNLLGNILRIDVDNPMAPNNYGIPGDNPFAASMGADRKEIYAWGLRNPWRFSFDRGTGRLFCGDVGQGLIEEVDIITLGGNYGWRRMEGTLCYNPATGCQTGSLILPISEYPHVNSDRSITGGYVYRGPAFPTLHGLYFYADYGTGRIRTLEETAPDTWVSTDILDQPHTISSFGEDEAGELYLCNYNGGQILRIIDADPQPTATPVPPSPSPSPTPVPPTPTPLNPSPSPTPVCCPGDADSSGSFVDAADFIAVQANFGADNGTGGPGDADCSGSFVDAADFIGVQANFGADCG